MECTFCGDECEKICSSCREPFCKYCGDYEKGLCESCLSMSGKVLTVKSNSDSFDDFSDEYF